MNREEFEIISFDVSAAGAVVTKQHATDLRHNTIKAIGVEVSDADSIPLSLMRMEIDSKRIFPDGFEVSRLVCSDAVEPNKRYYILPEPMEVNQAPVDIVYTDGSAAGSFAAYQVKVYLVCNVK